jgi:hypothetical protein
MNTKQIFEPVSLFYSYSHVDEQIRDQLDKHLATLRRLGLIKTWHDRCIGPGDKWNQSISDELEKADIILLLVSPDFIASDYCYSVEAKRALERHSRNEATVIPVVIRPVDFRGLPIADLQMLPLDGQPIYNQKLNTPELVDPTFKAVAEGLRSAVEKIIERRLGALGPRNTSMSFLEARLLDAAVAPDIPVGEFRDIVVLVRPAASEGLSSILSELKPENRRSSYSSTAADVRSEKFEAIYTANSLNEVRPPDYRLTVYAPDLITEDVEKRFILRPMSDTSVFTFFVKAQTEGEHRIRVSLHTGEWNVAEALLKTSSVAFKPGPGQGGVGLIASVELIVRAIAKAAAAR